MEVNKGRRRPADSESCSFAAASNRRTALAGQQTLPVSAFCACAAYAVGGYLVSSKLKKTLGVAHLRAAGADDLGGEVNLETPGRMPEIVARRCGA